MIFLASWVTPFTRIKAANTSFAAGVIRSLLLFSHSTSDSLIVDMESCFTSSCCNWFLSSFVLLFAVDENVIDLLGSECFGEMRNLAGGALKLRSRELSFSCYFFKWENTQFQITGSFECKAFGFTFDISYEVTSLIMAW